MIKKIYTYSILLFLGFHVLLPMFFYIIVGYEPIYGQKIPFVYLLQSALYITIVCMFSCVLIKKNKKKDGLNCVACEISAPDTLFFISVLLNVISVFNAGGFGGVLTGQKNSTLIEYVLMFFKLDVLFLLCIVWNQNIKKTLIYSAIYVIVGLLNASRSSLFFILKVFIMLFLITKMRITDNKQTDDVRTRNYARVTKNFRKTIKYLCVVVCVLAPIFFILASFERGVFFTNISSMYHLIIGRLSALELAALPIYRSDLLIANENLFTEKYGILNQIQQSINGLFPGNVWPVDVDPNQYYRAIFMGYSEEWCRAHYTSMNMTLPIYTLSKYGVCGFGIAVLIIYLGFIICRRIKNKKNAVIIAMMLPLELLNFFDWVYISRQMLGVVFTLMMVAAYGKIKKRIHIRFR